MVPLPQVGIRGKCLIIGDSLPAKSTCVILLSRVQTKSYASPACGKWADLVMRWLCRRILASGGGTADRTIKFWNTSTGSLLNSVDTGSQVGDLC